MIKTGCRRVVPLGHRSSLEDQIEMWELANIRNVNAAISLGFKKTVADSSHIGRVVVKPAIAFQDNQRNLLLRDKYTFRSIINDNQPKGLKFFNDTWDHFVIPTFSFVGNGDIEARVYLGIFLLRKLAKQLPRSNRCLIIALEQNYILLGDFLEVRITVKAFLRGFVEALKVSD